MEMDLAGQRDPPSSVYLSGPPATTLGEETCATSRLFTAFFVLLSRPVFRGFPRRRRTLALPDLFLSLLSPSAAEKKPRALSLTHVWAYGPYHRQCAAGAIRTRGKSGHG